MHENENRKEKRYRCGALGNLQCQLFVDYLESGKMPADDQLIQAGLKDDPPRGKLGRYGRFKGWASRMTLGSDSVLIFAKNRKIILPREKYIPTVKSIHTQNNKLEQHLTFSATLVKLHETYTMGRRQFGMSDELVRQVVSSCREGSCAQKCKKMEQYCGENPCFRDIFQDAPLDLSKHGNNYKKKASGKKKSTKSQVMTLLTNSQAATQASKHLIPVPMSLIQTSSKGWICTPVCSNKSVNPGYHLVYQNEKGKFQVSRLCSFASATPGLSPQTENNANVNCSTATKTTTTMDLGKQSCKAIAPKISKITATQIGNDEKVYTISITPETKSTTTVTVSGTDNKMITGTVSSLNSTGICCSTTQNKPPSITVPTAFQDVINVLEQALQTPGQTGCTKTFDVTFTFDNRKKTGTNSADIINKVCKSISPENADISENKQISSEVNMDIIPESDSRKRKADDTNKSLSVKNPRKQIFKVRNFDESSFSQMLPTADDSKNDNKSNEVNTDKTIESKISQSLGGQDVTPSISKEEIIKMWSLLLDPGPIPFPGIWYHYDDLLVENNCFQRLLWVIKDMKLDIMRCIVNDNLACDRLKRKMAYAETLLRHYKSFLQRTQKLDTCVQ